MADFRGTTLGALVATLGLLPAAMSHDIGSDSQRPFAIVIVARPDRRADRQPGPHANFVCLLGAPRRQTAPARTGLHRRRRTRGLGVEERIRPKRGCPTHRALCDEWDSTTLSLLGFTPKRRVLRGIQPYEKRERWSAQRSIRSSLRLLLHCGSLEVLIPGIGLSHRRRYIIGDVGAHAF
jgi:hypothetical protein